MRHVVLDASAVSGIDASAAGAIAEGHAGCLARSIILEVARATLGLRVRFDQTGITELLGPEQFHPTVTAAVDNVR